MKKLSIHLALILLGCSMVNAKQLKAYLSYATFYAPNSGPYIETYLSVDAHTVKLAGLSNKHYQSKIEVNISFSQHDSIKYLDKYNLLSPEIKDTNKVDFQFIDQQRISLKNGKYVFKITIADKNNNNPPFSAVDTVIINYKEGDTRFSDIEPIEKYESTTKISPLTKSGFNLTPYLGNFYSNKIKNLRFYLELYNSSTLLGNEAFLIKYYIIRNGNTQPYNVFIRQLKQKADKVNAMLGDFDITELPTGNYKLVVEAISRANKIIATNSFNFNRSNPVNLHESQDISTDSMMSAVKIEGTFVENYTNIDTLAEYIRCLRPISGTYELQFAKNQLKVADLKLMQQYLYSFWHRRKPKNPEQGWINYLSEVRIANAAFGTVFEKGYATDRGRVYLQYGRPNSIAKEYNDPGVYPYEIWHYYKLGNQSNRKFVFYAKALATNDFTLIYSDAIGEIHDDQWQHILSNGERTSPSNTNINNIGNDKLNDLFQSPR